MFLRVLRFRYMHTETENKTADCGSERDLGYQGDEFSGLLVRQAVGGVIAYPSVKKPGAGA